MPENTTRDAKLVQYLNEAYGKEKQLETALEAHIAMTTRPPYKRASSGAPQGDEGARPRRRTPDQGARRDRRGCHVPGPDLVSEAASKVQEVAHRGVALAQGPLHVVRGTGEEEKLLKNAKCEFADEAEEIANYTAIETLAESVGDRETAKIARRHPPGGRAHVQLPRAADPAAHQGGRAGRDPRVGAQRRAQAPQFWALDVGQELLGLELARQGLGRPDELAQRYRIAPQDDGATQGHFAPQDHGPPQDHHSARRCGSAQDGH